MVQAKAAASMEVIAVPAVLPRLVPMSGATGAAVFLAVASLVLHGLAGAVRVPVSPQVSMIRVRASLIDSTLTLSDEPPLHVRFADAPC